MADAPPTTYNSNTNLSLGSIPQVADPDLYEALMDIHNAIESLLRFNDSDHAAFVAYIDKQRNVTEVSASYTVVGTDGTVRVDASGGDIIVTLPLIATGAGYRYNIKRVDLVPANSVILLGDGAELIDGRSAGIKISTKSSYTVKANASGWDII